MRSQNNKAARLMVAFTLIICFLFNGLQAVFACSSEGVYPIFSYRRHADFPLREYAGGKVGIVPETFGRMSLFVFYRELNGLKLTEAEQKQVVEALDHRISNNSERNTEPGDAKNRYAFLKRWSDLHVQVTGIPAKLNTEKETDYSSFENCPRNAIEKASVTLEARLKAYGNTENVKNWLAGQDAVFSNCSEKGAMPSVPDSGAPEWLAFDREYQIAAAKFYAGDYHGARDGFASIAAKNSPWKDTANYLVARTYIRQASLIEVSDYTPTDAEKAENAKRLAEKNAILKQAADHLNSIIADPSKIKQQNDARLMLNLVKYRMDPSGRQKELAAALVQKSENLNLFNDLTDYIWLLDKSERIAHDKGSEADYKRAEATGTQPNYEYRFRREDFSPEELAADLSDWLFTYQMSAADSFNHAYAKMKETRSEAWLVSAILKARKDTPEAAELITAANEVRQNSPAFATVRYHQIRLLIALERRVEAKKMMGELNLQNYPISTRNKFLSLKTIVSADMDEFLKYAQRNAAGFVWGDDSNEAEDNSDKELLKWKPLVMFDVDAANFINTKMPLAAMRELALNKNYPEHLKKMMVNAVWTRAVILGNTAVEKEFAPLMQKYLKEFDPYLSKYATTGIPAERDAARLLLLLRVTSLTPYIHSANDDSYSEPTAVFTGGWWCGQTPRTEDVDGFEAQFPDFLSSAQIAAANAEREKMAGIGESATFLARRAIDFAKANPGSSSTPEILHLAVRSTRYACQDKNTRALSKQAFDILHKQFRGNAWTKKTPYFYGSKEE